MNLLDPTFIHNNCDYSFGDQSGHQNGLVTIKNANSENIEFFNKIDKIRSEGRNYMTLFIDNIRLYKRKGIKYTAREIVDETSKHFKDKVVKELFEKNDLLDLCSNITDMNFIIFTGFEDTPIDDEIFNKIPDNVLNIFASNAISFGNKVIPIPYGLKRKMGGFDNNHEILRKMINSDVQPSKLIYSNFSLTNPNRKNILENLKNKNWVTIETQRLNYIQYLNQIKNHKFVICPDGNAIGCECHRDWETLYMKRVPIVLDSQYLREIFRDLPVLFVNDFSDITQDLLEKNELLYQVVQELNLEKLDIKKLFEKCIYESLKKLS